MLVATFFISFIIMCLMVLRINTIIDAFDDWNYYVYRYINHCKIHYTSEEKPPRKLRRNYASKREAVIIFFMFWKMDAARFFDYKPDHEDILELYIKKK